MTKNEILLAKNEFLLMRIIFILCLKETYLIKKKKKKNFCKMEASFETISFLGKV